MNDDLKRKLLALLLSGVAIIMLMGAGIEQPVQAADAEQSSISAEEPVAPAEEPVDQIVQEQPEQTEQQPAAEEQPEPAPAPELDRILLLDGQPVPKAVGRTTINGKTYVSLKVMSQQLDTSAQVSC